MRQGLFPGTYDLSTLTLSQNHYYDIKYAMQLLLAQFMFKKSPKASLKALDSYISNAEA
jgi:Cohesin loading factor